MKHRYLQPSRHHQRVLYLALSGFAGVAVMQQFFFPLAPALPRVPEVLPSALAALKLQPVSRVNHQQPILFERQYVSGHSQRYQASDGTFLILTPLSSWMEQTLDPIKVSLALSPSLSLSKQKILTIRPNLFQIIIGQLAVGQFGQSSAYQGCLTRQGQVAINAQHLAAPRPGFWQKALHTLWPSSRYSTSCVLMTTNQRTLLDGSTISNDFIKGLKQSIVWPL
jgi:hypothetical protein